MGTIKIYGTLENKTTDNKLATSNQIYDNQLEQFQSEINQQVINNKESEEALRTQVDQHIKDTNNPHSVTKEQVGLGNVTNDAQVKRSEMGTSNGVATLNDLGQVPAHQLPSFVDDVIDVYATYDKSDTGKLSNIKLFSDVDKSIAITGESGKTYIDVEGLYQFRWTGSMFVALGTPTVIGDVPGTAFDGARGKALETSVNSHISDTSNPHQVTKEQVGLGNVDNTSDLNKPISTAVQSALNGKVDKVTGKSLVSDSQITKLEGLDDQDTLTSKIADAKKAGTDASSLANQNKNTIDNYTVNGYKISNNPVLNKQDIGLDQVNNTSDLDKPISSATQQALNNKADITQLVGKVDSNSDGTGEIFNDYTNNQATGKYSHSEGQDTIASGNGGAHAEGRQTTASGTYSHSEGYLTEASGTCNHSEGWLTNTVGYGSHAENYDTVAQGILNHVEGQSTYSFGSACHAEGQNSICVGNFTHAEGGGSHSVVINGEANSLTYKITISGIMHSLQVLVDSMNQCSGYRIGIGSATNSSRSTIKSAVLEENQSITVTLDKTLSASQVSNSAGFIYSNIAYGQTSHVENMINYGGGTCSHTEGYQNFNLGEGSHVEGYCNSSNNMAEHSEGKFNLSYTGEDSTDQTIHTVGIGTSNSGRKNAQQIMVNGDHYIYGIGNYDGTNYSSAQTLQEVVNNKADSIGIVTGSTGEVTQEISPNKFYEFGECSSLTITLGAEISNIYNEYMFQFSSGDTPTVLTLPETVKWIGDSLVDANKTYQVSIVNNIAVMGGA